MLGDALPCRLVAFFRIRACAAAGLCHPVLHRPQASVHRPSTGKAVRPHIPVRPRGRQRGPGTLGGAQGRLPFSHNARPPSTTARPTPRNAFGPRRHWHRGPNALLHHPPALTMHRKDILLILRTAGDLSQRHFGSQPRRPYYVCSGLEPHYRTSRYARRSLTPFTEEPLVLRTAVLLAAAPDPLRATRSGASPVAVLQQSWLRDSTTAPSCILQLRQCFTAVHACRACSISWLRTRH